MSTSPKIYSPLIPPADALPGVRGKLGGDDLLPLPPLPPLPLPGRAPRGREGTWRVDPARAEEEEEEEAAVVLMLRLLLPVMGGTSCRIGAEQKISSSFLLFPFTFSLFPATLTFSSPLPAQKEASCCSVATKELTAGDELAKRMREQMDGSEGAREGEMEREKKEDCVE